jgi:DNA-binding NarL/FixJ family response regulator
VYAGRTALCSEINSAIATSRLAGDASPIDALSPREFEILRMILDARSTDEIADAFNLSPKTVANHHYAIKSKLGAQSDIELVYICMKEGLVAPVLAPDAA